MRLRWDNNGERRYEIGVSKVVLFVDGKGEAWNGVTNITESPDGSEPTDIAADNIAAYAKLRSIEEHKGSISCYDTPRRFRRCTGEDVGIPGLNIRGQARKHFGLCYRSEIGADEVRGEGYKLHLIFNATVDPSESSYDSENDSPDVVEKEYEFTSIPASFPSGKKSSVMEINSLQVDPLTLSLLEDQLYGTAVSESVLPSPSEVVATLSRCSFHKTLMDLYSKLGDWLWDTFSFEEDTIESAIERESFNHVFYQPTNADAIKEKAYIYVPISETSTGVNYKILVVNDSDGVLEGFLEEGLGVSKETDGTYRYFVENVA